MISANNTLVCSILLCILYSLDIFEYLYLWLYLNILIFSHFSIYCNMCYTVLCIIDLFCSYCTTISLKGFIKYPSSIHLSIWPCRRTHTTSMINSFKLQIFYIRDRPYNKCEMWINCALCDTEKMLCVHAF